MTIVELAECDAYLSASDLSYDITALAAEWAGGDRSEPRLIVHVDTSSLPETIWMQLALENPELADASERVQEAVKSRLYSGYLSSTLFKAKMIQEGYSAASYAAIVGLRDFLQAGTSFVDDRFEGQGILVFLYWDAVPVCVCWMARDGIVSLSAQFVDLDALAECRNVKDVEKLFTQFGFELPCTELTME